MVITRDFVFIIFAMMMIIIMTETKQVQSQKSQNKFGFENGYPTQYLSGSIHYFRVHPSDWRDRLRKLRWAGFLAVQTYVEWSSHEPEPGVYTFSEELNLIEFLKIAKEEGLYVILRPGPFICAERDMGGLPYWLLRLEPTVRLRTSDERFMKYVRRWFNVLLPLLKPYMYEYGGPIVMVQVENEYGNSDACDFDYLTQLTNLLIERLGQSAFLFSTDNGRTNSLRCAKIPLVYATVDFGPDANITSEFHAQRLFNGGGPLINSEFYPGWLDHWGDPHETKSSEVVSSALNAMLSIGASVNFYVFHGGTSFGFGAGSNQGSKFQACPTSYDYDAPLNEAGDPTEKYFAIRNVVKNYFPLPSGPPPPPSEKYSYGNFTVAPIASVFDILPYLDYKKSKYPKTFEEMKTPNGLLAYETVLQKSISSPGDLSLFDIHDRGYVFIDRIYNGVASREEELFNIPISAFPNQVITIIVESQGRISAGPHLNDFKGLTSTPLINGNNLEDWKMIPIPLYNLTTLRTAVKVSNLFSFDGEMDGIIAKPDQSRMTFYEGNISIPKESSHPRDTFLKLDMFTKGYVWINSFLLGRFWPVMGPQITLYVPHGILHQGNNTILILELEGTTKDQALVISLVDKPEINGPTPHR